MRIGVRVYLHSKEPTCPKTRNTMCLQCSIMDPLLSWIHLGVALCARVPHSFYAGGNGAAIYCSLPRGFGPGGCCVGCAAGQMLILSVMRREKPDVLHCTVDGISPLFMLAAKSFGVPVVGSIHTDIHVSRNR